MIAVIKTGGKQYKVAPGQRIKIEKIEKQEGEMITFDDVLLIGDEKIIDIGTPIVEGAKVTAKVTKQDKGEKIVIFKYKPKKRYKVKKGHRQLFTEVEITDIKN
ncbi:MAG: 50S ribosomal protein L21 [Candidatus Pacebacteria bacterium]|nr:50S ribosomal protein L21 [Candidatus Paceibacterota bacterium]